MHSGFLIIDARDLCSVIVRDIVHVVQDLIRITLRDYRVGKAIGRVLVARYPLVAYIVSASARSAEHVDRKFPITIDQTIEATCYITFNAFGNEKKVCACAGHIFIINIK